jgi:hypothetical protein
MSPFQAVYYRAPDGNEPVRELLQSLDKKRRVSLRNQIARLNLLSDEVPHLPFPLAVQRRSEQCVVSGERSRGFHLIRAHLRYFNVDRELSTLLGASAALQSCREPPPRRGRVSGVMARRRGERATEAACSSGSGAAGAASSRREETPSLR